MKALKTAVSIGAAVMTLVGAKAAFAGTHGVVFIHGTGDYPGTMTCSGSGNSTVCTVPAAVSGYWTPGEISSVANGRAYAVVGYNGASCAPWPSGTTTGLRENGGSVSDPNYMGSCSTGGNADVIAAQIQQFITAGGITDLVMVTHSGGSNQARFILQNYTRNSNYSNIQAITKRVVTIAATTLGTYLANEAFGGVITSFIANIAGYGGEGVNFIRTNYMQTYNGTSSYFGGINNPVGGVNVYSTGGLSANTCVGFKLFGACIGLTVNSLGGSTCDSAIDDVGLQLLNSLYLNANDSSTARNNCSDGFISCMGSQKLGNTFSYATKQDHNQSRRQCNGLDVAIRNTVSASERGFADEDFSYHAPVQNADSCRFTMVSQEIVDSNGNIHGYGQGCSPSMLGNGHCDWDCVSMYGNDAKPTWDSTGKVVTGWASTGDCVSTTDSYGNTTSTNTPWTDANTYVEKGNTYTTTFTGKTGSVALQSTVWYTDPYAGTQYSVGGYCPSSWIGDGMCDECVLALYGADGNDCLPGRISSCAGVLAAANPATSGPNTPIYSEQDPSVSGNPFIGWYPSGSPKGFAATANNGYCEDSECGSSVTYAGTSWCNTTADCASGSTCVAGGCITNASNTDCTATYAVTPRGCATNADCTGNACQTSTGTCLLTGGACTTDANCPVPSGATSTCSSGGACSCTTSADCAGGAACNSGACSLTGSTSLCR